MTDGSLFLHIPEYGELWYRQKIMRDPETMSYNKGYDMEFEGYDKATGCIAFPKQEWADWYAYFVRNEPQRFYAYVARKEDGAWIGEVNVHKDPDAGRYEMGIVLEAGYRGKGYAEEALRLLLKHAFEEMGADKVHNGFEAERTAAVRAHLAAGFTIDSKKDHAVELLITRKQYFEKNRRPCVTPLCRENEAAFYEIAAEYLPGSCEETMRRRAAQYPKAFVLLMAGDEAAGVAFGWPRKLDAPEDDSFCLDGIAVKAPFWRNGYGSMLLHTFEDAVREYGFPAVSVGSAGGYVEQFYISNGYLPAEYKRYTQDGIVLDHRFESLADYRAYQRPEADGFVVMIKHLGGGRVPPRESGSRSGRHSVRGS